jgi:Ca2+-binding EF-hand superfamily protein
VASDSDKRELVRKVGELVRTRFGSNYQSAFQHYARKRTADPKVDRDELYDLLDDAGVGNGITRGAWASGIIRELDKDGDAKISWSEFEAVIKG